MKRLRIVQQIIIVLLFAVVVPFVTIGLIISNVSQQSVRRELNYSVTSISKYIAEGVQRYIANSDNEFSYIATALKDMPTVYLKNRYLTEIEGKSKKYSNLSVVPANSDKSDEFEFDSKTKTVKLYAKIDDKRTLTGNLKLGELEKHLNDATNNFFQSIFVFDNNMELVASNDKNSADIALILETLPKQRQLNKGVLFSQIKNQPIAYYQSDSPNWLTVVMTTSSVTKNTIGKARSKIIWSLLVAAFCILLTVGLYTYYLYINIRQLFKGITAISKGSYDRKIRLLKNIFTPHEIVFLEKEFNYMTQKVSQSYAEISEKNIELKRLNEYRDSLVSAISHEFRTPLTSIIGYTGRLMRKDIVIDEETRQKSLHTIKTQAQRLSRMVDDLLTVPDIESFHLSIVPEFVQLDKIIELCSAYSSTNNTQFQTEIDENLKPVYSDHDRLTQVIINLYDNAVKYNKDDSPIKIKAHNTEDGVHFEIANKTEPIPSEMIDKLYDKFTRLDSELTRTTRGTGLGLYIVKGLCDAMAIKISIDLKDEYFVVNLDFTDKETPNE